MFGRIIGAIALCAGLALGLAFGAPALAQSPAPAASS